MKGILLSTDFVKASDDTIRFIEANTDTVVYHDIMDVEFSWQPFIDHISGSYNTLHVVYKPELHYEAFHNLKAKLDSQIPSLAISESAIGIHDDYPESIVDADDKFILRLAYDGNAVLDSIYCRDSFEALKLMSDYNDQNLVVPFYGVSGSTVVDHLYTSSTEANVPDAVMKSKNWTRGDVDFYKVNDWDTFISGTHESVYISSFVISSASLAEGIVSSYRNYSVAFGSDLDTIDLGTTIAYAPFSLPTPEQIYIDGLLNDNQSLGWKHYHEFSTSTVKQQKRREGLFNTEVFTSASGEALDPLDAQLGDVINAFYVPGLPDTDDLGVYSNFALTGSEWPSGSQVTGSVVIDALDDHFNKEGLLYGLQFSGSDEYFYVGATTQILTYQSSSDSIKYRAVSKIEEDDIYLIDINNNIVDITSNKMIILNEPTGSFRSINLEPTDNIIVGNTPYFFAYHNPK